MKSRLVWQQAGERTFVLVLESGEEAFSAITEFAAGNQLSGASLTALGAFERASVGWFDLAARTYRAIEVGEQCEGLSLLGDIALGDDGKPSLHMHAVLGLSDGTTRGGHFLKGTVRPTLEVTIVETPVHLRRRRRPELGIALIDPA
jgi:predicted DNA-binding protein with PD1-like motif